MAHLPYAEIGSNETAALVQRIVAERGSVLHLYQMLLHSPPLAEGWLAMMTAVRQRLDLPGALRELVIVRIAHVNGAPYEAEQHVPLALREGLTAEQVAALADWQPARCFSDLQRCALELADTMTRDIHVAPELMARVRAHLGERQTVELAATIASYNMVSRFLEALAIRGDDPR
jgi:AhpD family alkylhydroperoxidase